jgi:L-amino acid N-acyltransferase YncA
MQKIYNYYVENTIFANEFDARTEEQIENRVDAIVKAGLPYLVAIARNNQRKGDKSFAKETVVGYASLDDYCDQSSMYRYTFELELYVHPGYTCQNVASCLLDRILEMANTGYNACGGYEYRNDSEYLKTGPARVIKTIMVTVHKEHGQSEDATMEYMKRFKFYRAGHIPQMGFKLGKAVDVFLYRHTTTETVDPNTRPTVPLERD